MKFPTGSIKAFKEYLNGQAFNIIRHKHKNFGNRSRLYGDYLYSQDREKFFVDMIEWLKNKT